MDKPVTFVYRYGEVRVRADQDSGRVELAVAGKAAELSIANASAVAIKLREAARLAAR